MKLVKIIKSGLLILLAFQLVSMLLFGCENAQKGVYDLKADVVGTDRTAKIYSKYNGQLVDTVTDKSMVFTRTENSTVLWLGEENKKVYIVNAMVIVKDN